MQKKINILVEETTGEPGDTDFVSLLGDEEEGEEIATVSCTTASTPKKQINEQSNRFEER